MKNKTEYINGYLEQYPNNEWKLTSGYGVFPLAPGVKPPETPGEVKATIKHNLVISFNFAPEFTD